MSNVKLVSLTPDAEKVMSYCARVSNPSNQESDNYVTFNSNHYNSF